MELYTCNRASCACPIELFNWPLLVLLFLLQNNAVSNSCEMYKRDSGVSNRMIKSLINMTITELEYLEYFKFYVAAKDFIWTRNLITLSDQRPLVRTMVLPVIYPRLHLLSLAKKKRIPSPSFWLLKSRSVELRHCSALKPSPPIVESIW